MQNKSGAIILWQGIIKKTFMFITIIFYRDGRTIKKKSWVQQQYKKYIIWVPKIALVHKFGTIIPQYCTLYTPNQKPINKIFSTGK